MLLPFLLILTSIQPISLWAIAEQQQQDRYQQEKCTQRGISPICDEELDHPVDDDKPFTIESARELIKSGVTTAKDLYEIGAITLQQKQQLEIESTPERL